MKGKDVLIKIQSELKVPKNQYNSFGNYKFRSCEDILEGVKPLLLKYNALLSINDEIVDVCGNMFVRSTSTFNCDDYSLSVSAYAMHAREKKGMDLSQITGSASSYARKYSLGGLFLIDDVKDSDNEDGNANISVINDKQKVNGIDEDDKPWLNLNTPEWEKVVDSLKKGYTINDVRKKYKVSKKNKELLLETVTA